MTIRRLRLRLRDSGRHMHQGTYAPGGPMLWAAAAGGRGCGWAACTAAGGSGGGGGDAARYRAGRLPPSLVQAIRREFAAVLAAKGAIAGRATAAAVGAESQSADRGGSHPDRPRTRGEKTAIELFIAGIRGWEAGLRRRLDNGKSKQD